MTEIDDQTLEARIREKAHELWEAEGRPDGRAEAHWLMAREIVANEDGYLDTLRPAPEEAGEPVEPAVALDNAGPFPGLADQDEETPRAPTVTPRS